jgi:hypothetical protein
MYVDSKSGNTLTVKRGQDATTKQAHVSGAAIKVITSADNDLIPVGDDFGFSDSL